MAVKLWLRLESVRSRSNGLIAGLEYLFYGFCDIIFLMDSNEIRKKFLDFFEKRGHAIIKSASLIPEDKTVLFTTAGMQPLVPYLMGNPHPNGHRLADAQKCLRTDDIDEVGDNRHLTFFEMLGNWSLGDPNSPDKIGAGYFKKESIAWSFELLTSVDVGFGIDPNKLSVTVFEGDKSLGLELDTESVAEWQKAFATVGIKAELGNRIYAYPKKKNWWELAGPGPGGPDTEIFYDMDTAHDSVYGEKCHVNCDCGKYVEIWNNVFMEFEKKVGDPSAAEAMAGKDGKAIYLPLVQKNVDTGMGFERLVMVLQGKKNVFETDLFTPITSLVPADLSERVKRIVADHVRAVSFLISDGVRPSNKQQGYILRRLMRRAMVHYRGDFTPFFDAIIKTYSGFYPELKCDEIVTVFKEEQVRFERTLQNGLKELAKLEKVDAFQAFRLYESFGLPYEVIKDVEVSGDKAKDLKREDFDAEFVRHQEISRAGAEKKFGGHGLILDTGELKAKDEVELKKVTRLHTATHLLQAALRKVLGNEVEQRGSDITAERTRFDFTFPRKLTSEEVKKVEDLVNEVIKKALPFQFQKMTLVEAKKTGALFFFKNKYPDEVNVYYSGDFIETAFSKEFCGGPHVKNTSELGQFKILKDEGVSAGVRRIRADVI